MPDEPHFLSAIDVHPDDRATRLVYADWLDEQGDPRAALIRVEEEMRTVPAWSDRYWELKPRRNALRQGCDVAWLERLRYGTDYEPTFADVPAGWCERWRLLREFTERWHRIPLPDVGGRADEVLRTEGKLQRTLPPAFREWVAFAADLAEQDSLHLLRDDYLVKQVRARSAISLVLESEGDVCWAVRTENLDQDDPPVEAYPIDYQGPPSPTLPAGCSDTCSPTAAGKGAASVSRSW